METVGGPLALLGAIGVILALVGDSIQIPAVKLPAVKLPAVRWTLGVTSLALLAAGGMMMTNTFPIKTVQAAHGSETSTSVASVPPSATSATNVKGPAPPPVAPTRYPAKDLEAAYRKSANAACVEARKQSAAGPQSIPDDPESIAAAASYIRDTLGKAAMDLGAIEAPDTLRSRHEAMVANISELSVVFGKAAEALQLGDSQTYDAAVTVIQQDGATHKRLATALGLKECAGM
jgi:hypothetical protein